MSYFKTESPKTWTPAQQRRRRSKIARRRDGIYERDAQRDVEAPLAGGIATRVREGQLQVLVRGIWENTTSRRLALGHGRR